VIISTGGSQEGWALAFLPILPRSGLERFYLLSCVSSGTGFEVSVEQAGAIERSSTKVAGIKACENY
jgi:hypothetical protein